MRNFLYTICLAPGKRKSTKSKIQSAPISKDNRSLNICIVPAPKTRLGRTYNVKTPE